MNRLAGEKSPYLLQHAHNPVDWHPWGEEARARARRDNKPILVSIGYATCHWCHVMERESFESPSIAELMNRHLVCVKVDREERPDVDQVYMAAVQALTGQGGWPLNVFLTPDLKPFIGGTYFPPDDRWGRPGWPRLVESIGTAWKDPDARRTLMDRAHALAEALARPDEGPVIPDPPDSFPTDVLNSYRRRFDPGRGGFSPAPKFPMPVHQDFLFRLARRLDGLGRGTEAREARRMALTTLRAMARGGLRDHLGGGFHRYSTDAQWCLPHFEKMLYDNAQLALNYLDAGLMSRDPFFLDVARDTLDYLQRDLRHPEGGFFSAEDADSRPTHGSRESREGAFYVWTADELRRLLGEDAPLVFRHYGVREGGNVGQDPLGEFRGVNVLWQAESQDGPAGAVGGRRNDVEQVTARAKATLLQARLHRPRPFRDDKILTSWNGLALSAFARAAGVIPGPWLHTARECATFLHDRLWDESEGRLYRRWRDGERAIPAQADDHAFLIRGLVDLHQAGGEARWLRWAERLADEFVDGFMDKTGSVFLTRSAELLPHRPRDGRDNVEPSAGSVAAAEFFRLAALLGRGDLADAARTLIAVRRAAAREEPLLHSALLGAALWDQTPPTVLTLVGPLEDPVLQDLWRTARNAYDPDLVLAFRDTPGPAPAVRPHALLCQNAACAPPVSTSRELEGLLEQKGTVLR